MKMLMGTPRAILVDLIRPQTKKHEAIERMEELEELMRTYGGLVVVKKLQRRNHPDNRTYIGKGKVEELKALAHELNASVLVLNNILKPGQIYNLSEALKNEKVAIWDRVDLILYIFAKHAQTEEAKLQIELARIRHMGPRIFGLGGEELARQAGGIGTRGIGETNTEIMKRHLRERERRVRERLERTQKMRAEQRKNRQRNGFKTAAIVGYTNAGKTTLLNALTGRREYAADKLFATLDTRTGKLYLPRKNASLLVSDTIGFIRDLPPELIEAFASTLSETVNADVLLHVVDAGNPRRDEHIGVVETILRKLKIENKPVIHVFNKADRLKKGEAEHVKELFIERRPVLVSALTDEGMDILIERLEHVLS